ncbi:MAG: diacylglycerol/lipid kinase family protein [Woeseia sp.]
MQTMNTEPVPLFVNPVAGRGRAGRKIARVAAKLDSLCIDYRVVSSESAGDLENRVFEVASDGVKRMMVAGGDGSIHEVTNGILRSGEPVELGVIPIGTGNDFAKACAVPLDWEEALEQLAGRIRSGAPARPIDAGRMNNRYFANGAGIGFDAKVTRIARAISWRIGDLVYLVAVFKAMMDGVMTPKVTIRFSDRTYEGPITLANVGNGAWVGGMFHIAPMAKIDDGRLDLVFAEPVSRPRIIALLPRLMRGSHIDQPEITHATVSRCEITATAPVPSHLDGEVQPLQTYFEIEVLKGALRLL